MIAFLLIAVVVVLFASSGGSSRRRNQNEPIQTPIEQPQAATTTVEPQANNPVINDRERYYALQRERERLEQLWQTVQHGAKETIIEKKILEIDRHLHEVEKRETNVQLDKRLNEFEREQNQFQMQKAIFSLEIDKRTFALYHNEELKRLELEKMKFDIVQYVFTQFHSLDKRQLELSANQQHIEGLQQFVRQKEQEIQIRAMMLKNKIGTPEQLLYVRDTIQNLRKNLQEADSDMLRVRSQLQNAGYKSVDEFLAQNFKTRQIG